MNNYSWSLYSEPYLAHFGILGMKWGARNGPPYPLSAGTHKEVVSGATSSQRQAAITRGGGTAASIHTTSSGASTNKTIAHGKGYVDSVLKKGTTFSRIQTSDKFTKSGAAYVAYTFHDRNQYMGIFPKNIRSRAVAVARKTGDKQKIEEAKNTSVYQVNLKANKDIAVASEKAAGKVTANLLKDKDFSSNLSVSLSGAKTRMRRPAQQKLISKAQYYMTKDPSSLTESQQKTIYSALNLALTYHGESDQAIQKSFYRAMKKAGYDAVVDVNDKYYSSYHSQKPLIVFNSSKLKVSDIKELSTKDTAVRYGIFTAERFVKELVNQPITAIPNSLSSAYYNVARTIENGSS